MCAILTVYHSASADFDTSALCRYRSSTMRALLFSILQIILSILLVAAILLQQRGTGLGAARAAAEVFRTKRGLKRSILRDNRHRVLFFSRRS